MADTILLDKLFAQITSSNMLVTPTGGSEAKLGDLLADGVFTSITGLSAGTAAAFVISGGTSTTAASQGGTLTLKGGTPGATGAGGTSQLLGADGGTTSGAGGVARVRGGAGVGAANGGSAPITGGASGAGATGDGGSVPITGGAATSTNGSGGNVTVTGGASTGTGPGSSVVLAPGAVVSGAAGGIRLAGLMITRQGAPTALTTSTTLTASQLLSGILVATPGGSATASYTLPTGTDLAAALPADFTTADAFSFSLINVSTDAAEDVDILTAAGWTLVGSMAVQSNDAITSKSSGRFLVRKTGATSFVLYRIS